jgi:hypothetical protein
MGKAAALNSEAASKGKMLPASFVAIGREAD